VTHKPQNLQKLDSPDWQTIILIDDDAVLNLIHKKILDIIKFQGTVLEFYNGFKAIEYIRNHPEINLTPVLIILDLEMPILDGWGFLKSFANLDPEMRRNYKIVVSSSSNNPEEIKKAMEIEFVDDFFPKPLTFEIISRLVGKREMESDTN